MTKNYVLKHYPPPPLPHSFGPGTFALNSRTFNPLFEKILDPPLLISKKTTLHLQHTFNVHFFAVILHDYNLKLFMVEMLYVFLFIIFRWGSFSPWWPVAFIIFSSPL